MTTPPLEDLVEVRILEMPLDILRASQQHSEELMRELTLVAEQLRQEGTHGLPIRFVDVAQELTTTYGSLGVAQEATIAEAMAAGERVLHELVYRLPPALGAVVRHLDDLFDEADDYCRSGEHLLTLCASPPVVALRKWFFSEVERQIGGAAPTAWPEYRARRGGKPE